MSRLKKEHKVFIVKQLACFESPSEISRLFSQKFGKDLPANQVLCYNPETSQGSKLSKGLRHIYYDTRRKFVEKVSEHEISKKGYRIGILQKMAEKELKRGNHVLTAALLKQAAEEVGGAYERGLLPIGNDGGGSILQQVNQIIINQQNNVKKD